MLRAGPGAVVRHGLLRQSGPRTRKEDRRPALGDRWAPRKRWLCSVYSLGVQTTLRTSRTTLPRNLRVCATGHPVGGFAEKATLGSPRTWLACSSRADARRFTATTWSSPRHDRSRSCSRSTRNTPRVVVAAHRASVRAAMSYLEDRALVVRETRGGDRHQHAASWRSVVSFTHGLNRHGEPTYSDHVLIGARPAGERNVLDSRALYAHAPSADGPPIARRYATN